MATIEETLDRGWQHHQQRQYREAAEYYREVLSQDPGHPAARYCVGRLSLDLKRYDLAVEHLSAAIQADPAKAVYHADLGHAHGAQRVAVLDRIVRSVLESRLQ